MNYHKSYDTLPYYNFLQIRKHDDLRYLFELDSYLNLSKAKAGPEHIKAFEGIMDEYNNHLLKRNKPAMLFDYEKQIKELETERFICQLCLSQLKILPDNEQYKEARQRFITELDNQGYSFTGNIQALEGKIDSILNEIDDLVLGRDRISGTSGTISDTERVINEVEKYRKVSIDIYKISVKQFLVYEDDYIDYVASLNKNRK